MFRLWQLFWQGSLLPHLRPSSHPHASTILLLLLHTGNASSYEYPTIMPESHVVIVTGASRGIGLAIAQYLLRASHKLVLVARSAEPLQKLKAEYPGQVEYISADLSDFSVRNPFLKCNY